MSEIEKALAVKEKSQAIGEFLEWAQSEGYFLASWQHFGNPEPFSVTDTGYYWGPRKITF